MIVYDACYRELQKRAECDQNLNESTLVVLIGARDRQHVRQDIIALRVGGAPLLAMCQYGHSRFIERDGLTVTDRAGRNYGEITADLRASLIKSGRLMGALHCPADGSAARDVWIYVPRANDLP